MPGGKEPNIRPGAFAISYLSSASSGSSENSSLEQPRGTEKREYGNTYSRFALRPWRLRTIGGEYEPALAVSSVQCLDVGQRGSWMVPSQLTGVGQRDSLLYIVYLSYLHIYI